MSQGKLIVIEGIDGSGKKTQLDLLTQRLITAGQPVKVVDFPQYGKRSAIFVEDYLNGNFGNRKDITPYQASIFYALDRFAAKRQMADWLDSGFTLLANRYTTSNQGHQGSMVEDPQERKKFLSWVENLEYEIFGIPRPDLVVFLNVEPQIAWQLILQKGERQYLDGKKQDILEADFEHLCQSHAVYTELSQGENWRRVDCVADGKILPVEKINEKIWQVLKANS